MTYDYKCDGCTREFELEQKIKDKPVTKCMYCGRHTARRLISGSNFQLVGKGWYKDGYSKGA